MLAVLAVPQVASAQDAAAPAAATAAAPADAAPAADAAAPAAAVPADGEVYRPLGPDMIKGQPHSGAITFQDQYSPNGEYALWMHDWVLMPIIAAITLLVLGLLLVVMTLYNRRKNPVPSKTSHNTLIEVIWTGVPVLILVIIAVPSITLLSRQYKSAPENALTIKVTGYQWYWGYSYPDNGGFEVISNMMPDEEAVAKGLPPQLAVDHRMVVPVGEPIRIQTFGADVIHSFAVPSLWFKLDAVPGRINERELFIEEPGIYYGQCSELCGARHGYMPIAVEAVPRAQFDAWVRLQGGTVGGAEQPTTAPALIAPDSAIEGAPAAGEAPEANTPNVTPGAEA
nr:cytochrome c oxidase subunit II [Altererythrobacter sp. B11]